MAYALLSEGKRLRPALVLGAAHAVGAPLDDVLPAACAVEMIHAYSLVHDDLPIMDDDDERRGRPSTHVKFDEATALLVGDALLVAPVLTASVAERPVLLPAGTWYDWETGEAHEGGGEVTLQVPLRELGLLARAGAVVPMLPEGVQTLRRATGVTTLDDVRRVREVRVWLGADGAAREPEGGAYSVVSPGRPSGITSVTGAEETSLDEPGHLVVRAGPGEVTLGADDGTQHILRAEGVASDMRVTWDVRW
ncbi:MAG: polyprenyl synthetase family protein [Myxococcales bacterium]|nr:polyprenyl synthetase family protein [Myxococcales bacterium]